MTDFCNPFYICDRRATLDRHHHDHNGHPHAVAAFNSPSSSISKSVPFPNAPSILFPLESDVESDSDDDLSLDSRSDHHGTDFNCDFEDHEEMSSGFITNLFDRSSSCNRTLDLSRGLGEAPDDMSDSQDSSFVGWGDESEGIGEPDDQLRLQLQLGLGLGNEGDETDGLRVGPDSDLDVFSFGYTLEEEEDDDDDDANGDFDEPDDGLGGLDDLDRPDSDDANGDFDEPDDGLGGLDDLDRPDDDDDASGDFDDDDANGDFDDPDGLAGLDDVDRPDNDDVIANGDLGDVDDWNQYADYDLIWDEMSLSPNQISTYEEARLRDDDEFEWDSVFVEVAANLSGLTGNPPAARRTIESLPEGLVEDGSQCAICGDEFSADDKARQLPCCHHYHGDCIIPWLRMRNTCPVCRYELPTDDPEKREWFGEDSGSGSGSGSGGGFPYDFHMLCWYLIFRTQVGRT
ncbi:hypothetical protein Dimus_034155 [Dionaea muscipula]